MIHNSDINQEMPYFINKSKNLSNEEKKIAYKEALSSIRAILTGETDSILKMATINALVKTHLPYSYWAGFYRLNNGKLTVSAYQGTVSCLHIALGKGVCGTVAVSQQTKIVDNVHLLAEGEDHITCDPNSKSEIVVPVFDKDKNLIAVFDVDSTQTHSFNEIDQEYLELIMKEQFAS